MKEVIKFMKRFYIYCGKVWYINLAGMVLVSVLEGMGIFLLVPLLSVSGILKSSGSSFLMQYLPSFDDYSVKAILPIVLGIYVLVVVLQNIIQRKLSIFTISMHQGFIQEVRIKLYESLLYSNWNLFITKRKSDLINLLTIELARVNAGVGLFMQLLTSLIFTAIQIGIAFCLSPNITAFVLLSGLILAFFSRKFIKRSKLLGNKTSQLAQHYFAGITDQLNGIKDIKVNNLETSRLQWLTRLNDGMVQEQIDYARLKSDSQLFYKGASAILIAVFIYLSVNLFQGQAGQLLIILLIFSKLWPRFTGIQSSFEQLASYIPSFVNIHSLEEETKLAQESEAREMESERLELVNEIECRDVTFRYNQKEYHYALEDINLSIPANRMTAIVGKSGGGKSTLIDILTGLNQPEQGDVLIDGHRLSGENVKALRQSISYVPQDPFLFNESIRDNLLIVHPDASEEDIWGALEFSACAEFVRKLPNGLDTQIGDRGVKLSGGERQRLVLARAILKKPSILIMDEATSSLDTENESKIQMALERIKGSMTIIVIAHRLSTIRNADQVVVLEKGRIVQKGGFKQLAEGKGMFQHLLSKQIGNLS
ncbi:ABC transporter ATP-binding protein [Fictibacillus fluitans]|uniref:ABC transporter ATP-binding protein n=1 Tax=Fictibacillus fluitans TaxID=3058422 RepID=A0ABT8I145_9BACL|nr:ABC transporter ATP-binding protein [Fictibacillus sp. NE201]MDN4526740.1 ABC transporter ATP-binding protein [Fictibacillus sp. NE201]